MRPCVNVWNRRTYATEKPEVVKSGKREQNVGLRPKSRLCEPLLPRSTFQPEQQIGAGQHTRRFYTMSTRSCRLSGREP